MCTARDREIIRRLVLWNPEGQNAVEAIVKHVLSDISLMHSDRIKQFALSLE